MTPERWREIERLYHLALERDAGERAALLTEACRGDDALRREVESLLDYQGQTGDFIEQPAVAGRLAGAVRRLEQSSVPGRFVGRVFGSYEVKALIAAGGMGEVYRAVDTRLNRTVAIKTLPAHLSSDPERRERFTREARIVSSLNHPHICTLHDIGVQDDVQYLVMEHIDGETLQKRLEQGPLPLAQALEYAIQIVDALDKAHRRGIVHRDLKPGNVMLAKSGVKLLDFGLAMWQTPAAGVAFDDPTRAGSHALTAEGTILGTLQYISPEQLEGKPSDARTDIFAFGAVAYEMITGRSAFPAANQAQLVGAILKDDPPPIADLVPEAPRALSKTISRCLAKDPDERWQTANDLLYQLRSIASSPQALDTREPQARRRVPRRIERGLWMAVLAASIVGTFLWSRTRDDPSRLIRSRANPRPLHVVSGVRHDVPFRLRSVVCAVPGRPAHRLCRRHGERTETAVASLSAWRRDAIHAGHGRSELAVLVARQPMDRVLRRQQPEEGPRVQRARAAHRQQCVTRGGAAWNAADVILFPPGTGWFFPGVGRGGAVSRCRRLAKAVLAAVPGRRGAFHLRRRYLPQHQYRFPERRGVTEPDEVPGSDFFPRLRARIHFLRAGCDIVRTTVRRGASRVLGGTDQDRGRHSHHGSRPCAILGLRRRCAGILAVPARDAGRPSVVRSGWPRLSRHGPAGAVPRLHAVA